MKRSLRIPELPFSWVPRSDMLICSLATGPSHMTMLKIGAQTASCYALKYGMDAFMLPMPELRLAPDRPPAWDKLVMIYHALHLYPTVMWIDADAIICDPGRDIREVIDSRCPMYLVAHKKESQSVPNTGVWVLRKDKRTFEMLEAIWNHTAFLNHPWWEQGALIDLIGYEAWDLSCRFRRTTRYTPWVRFLDETWNSRRRRPAKYPSVLHFLGRNKPLEEFRQIQNQFFKELIERG